MEKTIGDQCSIEGMGGQVCLVAPSVAGFTGAGRVLAGIALTAVLLAAAFLPVQAQQLPEGNAERGAKLFSQCQTCHEVGADAVNKVGPHLDNLFGRKAGGLESFRYSNAMREAGQNGLVWDAQSLSEYMEKPRDFIPGNRMSYRGMAKPQDRADLIAWLSGATLAQPSAEPAAGGALQGVAPGFTEIVLQIEGDPDYGEYLAGECVTCHQQSGRADGIPSIVGLPREYFIRSLFEYKTNVRDNEVMKLRVQNLGNEELAALAAYFSQLDPQ